METMEEISIDIITWIVMAFVVVLYVLGIPVLLVCALIFRDWGPVRMPSKLTFSALDFVLFGDLTREYSTTPRWYYPPWRRGWWARIRRA